MYILILITILLIYIGYKIVIFRLKNYTIVDLDKRVIFVTGCDSGIGLETAKHFHELGFIVFAGCLDINSSGALELNSLSKPPIENSKKTKRIHIVQLDITQTDSLINAVNKLDTFLREHKELAFHCLINNAGVCIVGEFDWLTLEHVEKIVNVNVIGTLRVIKLFLRLIIEHQGRIVIVGSVNAHYAYPCISVYCATKSALNLFGRSLRYELNKFGVKVCVINPGDYANKTKIMANQSVYFEEMIRKFSEEQMAFYKGYIGRFMELTDQNAGITGSENSDRTLFKDMDKLIIKTNPPFEILSVQLINRIILYLFFGLPIRMQLFIFQKVWDRVIKS